MLSCWPLAVEAPTTIEPQPLSFGNIPPNLLLSEPIRSGPVRTAGAVTVFLDFLVRLKGVFKREWCNWPEDRVNFHTILLPEKTLQLLRLCPLGDREHLRVGIVIILAVSVDLGQMYIFTTGVLGRWLGGRARGGTWRSLMCAWWRRMVWFGKRYLAVRVRDYRVSRSLRLSISVARRTRLGVPGKTVHGQG